MIKTYLQEIQKLYNPNAREHAYRTPLQNFLTNYVNNNYQIHHENKSDDGTPDFTVKSGDGQLIGFIECKDIDIALLPSIQNKKSSKDGYKQLKKYLTIAPILIYTNYIEFYLLTLIDEKIEILDHCELLSNIEDKISLNTQQKEKFNQLLDTFLQSKPQAIKNQKAFISQIARQTKILNELILEENKDSYFKKDIQGLFNNTIFKDLDESDFAGAFSQLITFSLLFYRLTERKNVSLDTFKHMPNYIPIFKELLNIFDPDRCNNVMFYTIESIINSINSYDETMFHKDLSYKEIHDTEDPFIYMYEIFLKEFDPEVRNARGVFYTPLEVVRYMIRSLDELLKECLSLAGGLRNKNVYILDFATGTGTFLLGAIEYIYQELIKSNNQGLWESQVSDFILKQLYGFEYMVVPYILAHFRIHEYLNACNYEYKHDERLQLYLTNTLDNSATSTVPMFPNMNNEADMAYKIKNENPILVIMGNPPYNNYGQMNKGKWIAEKLKTYKENLNEQKINLNDDYIKFIRFAHWKLENIDKGVLTVIVNNSFISGITHREMRNKLMQTFDEIYIYDLHGNINKGEVNPKDGSMDFNIFDIKNVGVCIATFVKTGIKDNPNRGVYYQEIYGTQKEKKAHLNNISWEQDTKDKKWLKLHDDPKWHWFVPKTTDVKYWNEFVGLNEIFNMISSGIETWHDHMIISKDIDRIKNNLNHISNLSIDKLCSLYNFTKHTRRIKLLEKAKIELAKKLGQIQQIHYRPFDFQYIYYTKTSGGCVGRPRYNTMKHLINKDNIGLVFSRKNRQISNGYFFISNKIIDRHALDSAGDSMVIAPLYIYTKSNSGEFGYAETKIPNFTKEFNNTIKTHPILKDKTPEQILAYIYAILYMPFYRSKYAEDLAYDYPRIPFITNQTKFDELQKLGQELIDIHLMKIIPTHQIGYPIDGDNIVSTPKFLDNKLYINDTQYFSDIDENVWNYTIGGYQVLDKWLKARKEIKLSLDDITHLQNIMAILSRTIQLQKEIEIVGL